jgi:hypothetical protein
LVYIKDPEVLCCSFPAEIELASYDRNRGSLAKSSSNINLFLCVASISLAIEDPPTSHAGKKKKETDSHRRWLEKEKQNHSKKHQHGLWLLFASF